MVLLGVSSTYGVCLSTGFITFLCVMGTMKDSYPPESLNAAQWASTILLQSFHGAMCMLGMIKLRSIVFLCQGDYPMEGTGEVSSLVQASYPGLSVERQKLIWWHFSPDSILEPCLKGHVSCSSFRNTVSGELGNMAQMEHIPSALLLCSLSLSSPFFHCHILRGHLNAIQLAQRPPLPQMP